MAERGTHASGVLISEKQWVPMKETSNGIE